MKVLIKEKLSPHKSKTPEGYLICRDAILARTGEQEYYASELYPDWDKEDKQIKVMRKPEQVFSAETIASFENKPITCEHPDEDVTPLNYKDYSVGFVRDVRRSKADGQDVMIGNLIITDSDIINDIENGIRTELSCGYNCDITGGDQPEQVNIRGNHVALCEQGRAGNAKIVDSISAHDAVVAKYTDPDTAPWVKVSKGKFHEITGTWPKSDMDLIGPVSVETEKAYLVYLHPAQEFVHTGYGWQRTSDKEGWVPKSLATVIDPAEYFAKSNVEDTKAQKYIPGDVGFLKQIEDIAFEAKADVENAKDREKAFFDIYARLDNLVRNLSEQKKELGVDMANGIITRLKKTFDLEGKGLTELSVNDVLIQSGSKEALKKNIETEIKAGKDPKQAAAIAYSVQRANDTKPSWTIMWIIPNGDDPDTGTSVVSASSEELAKETVKRKHPKAKIIHVMKGNLGGEYAEVLFADSIKRTCDAHYEVRPVKGHYEIYKDGEFLGTADDRREADEMIEEDTSETIKDDFRGEIVDAEDYRGYDIKKNDLGYIVDYEDQDYTFSTIDSAKTFLDEQLNKAENMIRDYAIRKAHDSLNPEIKKELRKEVARKIAEIKPEESEEDSARLDFRKTKRSLLAHLKEQQKALRDE